MILELCADNFLLYIVNIYQCNLFTIHSFYNNLFTVTGNNYTMHSKDRMGNRNFHSKLPIIVFQSNFQLAKLSQKNLGKPRLCTAGGIRLLFFHMRRRR